jgi:hypothetical protein
MKMKGNINKEMAKKMKRKESLDLKLRGNQPTSKIDQEKKKIEKMVVTVFGKGRIIVLEMDKL